METFDNVLGLASWLDSEICAFAKTSDVIYFFEKPWKWTREYGTWQLWCAADSDEMREFIVNGEIEQKDAETIKAEMPAVWS